MQQPVGCAKMITHHMHTQKNMHVKRCYKLHMQAVLVFTLMQTDQTTVVTTVTE